MENQPRPLWYMVFRYVYVYVYVYVLWRQKRGVSLLF